MNIGSQSAIDSFFITRWLPCAVFEVEEGKLVLPASLHQRLARYAHLISRMQQRRIVNGLLSGLVVFEGPSGVGKTMCGKAFGQSIAHKHFAQFKRQTLFLELRMSSLFRELLGRTVEAIAQAFEIGAFEVLCKTPTRVFVGLKQGGPGGLTVERRLVLNPTTDTFDEVGFQGDPASLWDEHKETLLRTLVSDKKAKLDIRDFCQTHSFIVVSEVPYDRGYDLAGAQAAAMAATLAIALDVVNAQTIAAWSWPIA